MHSICFADFRSDDYPSNLGLKDQVIALQWVKKNIRAFGGDPDRITLQGTSSGAVSVHYHMMSPLSKGLFHAGISESGTALDSWSIVYPLRARQLISTLASRTDCFHALPKNSSDDASALAECLRKKSAYDILAATRSFDLRFMQMLFLPVIEITKDRPFIPDDPYVADEDNIPWLTGQNSDEVGLMNRLDNPWLLFLRIYLMSIAYDSMPYWLNYKETSSNTNEVSRKIMQYYAGTYMPNQSKLIPDFKMISMDCVFSNPHYMSLLKHQGPKYSYVFSYRQTTMDGNFLHPDTGVTHSEEQFYLFIKEGHDIQAQNPPEDVQMSKTLVKLWVNFIKYHDPTPQDNEFESKWELWTPNTNLSYHFDQKSIKMVKDSKMKDYEFWKNLPYRDKMSPFKFYYENINLNNSRNNPRKTNETKRNRSIKINSNEKTLSICLVLLIMFSKFY